jgi:hypothetical protein
MRELISNLPICLNDSDRVRTATYLASFLGECQVMTEDDVGDWEVTWHNVEDGYGVWLTKHGVYISNEVDAETTFRIVGYCAYRGYAWLTDDTLLQLAAAQKETKQ